MRILKKIEGQIRSIIIRDSRVEIELEDNTTRNYYLSQIPTELDKGLTEFFLLVKNKELDAGDRKKQLGTDMYLTDPVQGTRRAILNLVKDLMELHGSLGEQK